MILLRLNCAFRGIDTIIIGLHKLLFALLLFQEIFQRCPCLIVPDVQTQHMAFLSHVFPKSVHCRHGRIVLQVAHWNFIHIIVVVVTYYDII